MGTFSETEIQAMIDRSLARTSQWVTLQVPQATQSTTAKKPEEDSGWLSRLVKGIGIPAIITGALMLFLVPHLFKSLTDSQMKDLGKSQAELLNVEVKIKELSGSVAASLKAQGEFDSAHQVRLAALTKEFEDQKAELIAKISSLSSSIQDPKVRDSFISAIQEFAALPEATRVILSNTSTLNNQLSNVVSDIDGMKKERARFIQAWQYIANALDGWYEEQNTKSLPLSKYADQADLANYYLHALNDQLGVPIHAQAVRDFLQLAEQRRKK